MQIRDLQPVEISAGADSNLVGTGGINIASGKSVRSCIKGPSPVRSMVPSRKEQACCSQSGRADMKDGEDTVAAVQAAHSVLH